MRDFQRNVCRRQATAGHTVTVDRFANVSIVDLDEHRTSCPKLGAKVIALHMAAVSAPPPFSATATSSATVLATIVTVMLEQINHRQSRPPSSLELLLVTFHSFSRCSDSIAVGNLPFNCCWNCFWGQFWPTEDSIVVDNTTVVTAVTSSTDWEPCRTRLAANCRYCHRCSPRFRLNFGRSRPPLPLMTT